MKYTELPYFVKTATTSPATFSMMFFQLLKIYWWTFFYFRAATRTANQEMQEGNTGHSRAEQQLTKEIISTHHKERQYGTWWDMAQQYNRCYGKLRRDLLEPNGSRQDMTRKDSKNRKNIQYKTKKDQNRSRNDGIRQDWIKQVRRSQGSIK